MTTSRGDDTVRHPSPHCSVRGSSHREPRFFSVVGSVWNRRTLLSTNSAAVLYFEYLNSGAEEIIIK